MRLADSCFLNPHAHAGTRFMFPYDDYNQIRLTCFTVPPHEIASVSIREYGTARGQHDLPRKHLHRQRFHAAEIAKE